MRPIETLLHILNQLHYPSDSETRRAAWEEFARALDASPVPNVDGSALRRAWRAGALAPRCVYPALDAAFGHPSCRLLVYGSLAPGRRHADVLAPVGGQWLAAEVRGCVATSGEYPCYHWRPDAPILAVHCLASDALPAHWARIDDFEGSDYRRIWVAARCGGLDCVASIYAAAPTV